MSQKKRIVWAEGTFLYAESRAWDLLDEFDIVFCQTGDEVWNAITNVVHKPDMLVIDPYLPPGEKFKMFDTGGHLRTGLIIYHAIREIDKDLVIITMGLDDLMISEWQELNDPKVHTVSLRSAGRREMAFLVRKFIS